MKYSTGFRNSVLKKVIPPENRSVASVSKEMRVAEQTIYNWIAKMKNGTLDPQSSEMQPGSRTINEKLSLLLEGKTKTDKELGEWLRENGLHSEHLNLWEQELKETVTDKDKKQREEIKRLKQENKKLEKELLRKEKALAEMAALMTLKKKADEIWGDDEDD